MEYKIIKNFVSKDEQKKLAEWIINNKDTPGLFKDAGQKGREFIDAFIKHCSTDELYITTNVVNEDNKNIVRYHRLMELVEKQKNSYINNMGQVKMGSTEQILWKLDLDKYYSYQQIRGFL